ncbi:hypothetical protein V7x_10540 [Crateriforma conspicua]|uniref:Uncharacterized protein n=1 Tax=Crateriforma conspicua TaxID=2527996 RepID=A0A5C6FR03_9PLAN|nr:hypothetical protein [Crateriforma conspicua]TWU65507.1 hypothetical protein V7x_10540 [Crateriforma conspicua]
MSRKKKPKTKCRQNDAANDLWDLVALLAAKRHLKEHYFNNHGNDENKTNESSARRPALRNGKV